MLVVGFSWFDFRRFLALFLLYFVGDRFVRGLGRFYIMKSLWGGRYYFVYFCKNIICFRGEGEVDSEYGGNEIVCVGRW